jgi:hypothetical protein
MISAITENEENSLPKIINVQIVESKIYSIYAICFSFFIRFVRQSSYNTPKHRSRVVENVAPHLDIITSSS